MRDSCKTAWSIGVLAVVAGCGGAEDDRSVRVEAFDGDSTPRAWCTPTCVAPEENAFEQALQSTWIANGWGTPPSPSPFSTAGQNWVMFVVGPDKAPAFVGLVATYATIAPVNSGWYDAGTRNGSVHYGIVYDPSNPPNHPHSGGY